MQIVAVTFPLKNRSQHVAHIRKNVQRTSTGTRLNWVKLRKIPAEYTKKGKNTKNNVIFSERDSKGKNSHTAKTNAKFMFV